MLVYRLITILLALIGVFYFLRRASAKLPRGARSGSGGARRRRGQRAGGMSGHADQRPRVLSRRPPTPRVISLVAPVYCEEEGIEEFYGRAKAMLAGLAELRP